jgi:hypothetical protein
MSVTLKTCKIWARRWIERPKRGNRGNIHDIVENGQTSWKTRLASQCVGYAQNMQNLAETLDKTAKTWKPGKNPRYRGKRSDIMENTTSVSRVSVTLKTCKIWARDWTERPKRGNQEKIPRDRRKQPDIVENTTSVSRVSVTLKTCKIWTRRWIERPKHGNWGNIHDIVENGQTSWKTRLASQCVGYAQNMQNLAETLEKTAKTWKPGKNPRYRGKRSDIVENTTSVSRVSVTLKTGKI